VLVDTHCHLHLLEGTADELVGQARVEGVGHVVDVGIDVASSRGAAANAARLPDVSASAGVHPHDAVQLTREAVAELRGLLARPEVVAVGETGLDYYRDHSPRAVQLAAFATHVRLARELDLALVVHCRDAFEDVVAVLEGEGAPERVVFHCFTGDDTMAGRVVEAGWVVSFSGTVTFRNAPEQRAAFQRWLTDLEATEDAALRGDWTRVDEADVLVGSDVKMLGLSDSCTTTTN